MEAPAHDGKQQTEYQPRLIPGDVKSLVVKQSNSLATSIQEMTLLERRVLLLALAVLQRSDTRLPVVRIYAGDVRRIFQLNRNSLNSELDEVSSKLLGRYVEFYRSRHGSNSRIAWVSEIHYTAGPDSETGQAYLDLQLHDRMATHVLQLNERFFKVPLWVQARCTSEYSLRFLDILMAESHSGRKKSVAFDLDDLFTILKSHRKSYAKNFSNFRRRVLEPVQNELKEIGFLTFEYEPIKRGRKIIALSFQVAVNHALEGDDLVEYHDEDVRRLALENQFRQAGFSGNLQPYFNSLSLDQIEEVYRQARAEERQARESKSPIRNFGAFLRFKLEDAAQNPVRKLPPTLFENGSISLTSVELQRKADDLVQEFTEARTNFAWETYQALDEDSGERVRSTALTIDPWTAQQINQQGGESSNLFRHAVRRVLEEEGLVYPEKLADIDAYLAEMSLEEYDKETVERVLALARDAV